MMHYDYMGMDDYGNAIPVWHWRDAMMALCVYSYGTSILQYAYEFEWDVNRPV